MQGLIQRWQFKSFRLEFFPLLLTTFDRVGLSLLSVQLITRAQTEIQQVQAPSISWDLETNMKAPSVWLDQLWSHTMRTKASQSLDLVAYLATWESILPAIASPWTEIQQILKYLVSQILLKLIELLRGKSNSVVRPTFRLCWKNSLIMWRL